jgi:hypothetical protein
MQIPPPHLVDEIWETGSNLDAANDPDNHFPNHGYQRLGGTPPRSIGRANRMVALGFNGIFDPKAKKGRSGGLIGSTNANVFEFRAEN